jgi:hypothetical protein
MAWEGLQKLPSIWSNSPPSLYIVTVVTAKCDLKSVSYIFANPWNFLAQYIYYLLTFSCTWMQSQCIIKERDHYSGTFNATIHIVCGGGGADLSSFTPFTPSWGLGGIIWPLLHKTDSFQSLFIPLWVQKKQHWQSVWPILDYMKLQRHFGMQWNSYQKLSRCYSCLVSYYWAIELFWRWMILGCDMHLLSEEYIQTRNSVLGCRELKCTALVVRSFKLAPKVHASL